VIVSQPHILSGVVFFGQIRPIFHRYEKRC